MVKSTRLMALLVMVVLSTVSPLVYQKGVEPISEGLNCEITILDLEMDTQASTDKQIVFVAYLSIKSDAAVPVKVPYLDLDVFQKDQRYELIGKFKTTSTFTIDPYGEISTRKVNGEVVKTPASLDNAVVANLTLGGHGVARNLNETIKTLFEGDSVFLQLKGEAQDGPFTFNFEKQVSRAQPFFDPEFKIIDIFNYYSSNKENQFPNSENNDTESNCFVVRTEFSNPSLIPFVIRDYKFNLYYEKTNELLAEGLSFMNLGECYDPDITKDGIRKNIIDLYYDGKYYIEVPNAGVFDNKRDMFFIFNFTDPLSPINPTLPESKTTDNINKFMRWIFENDTLQDLSLIGYLDVNLGYVDDLREVHGIRVKMGSLQSPNTTLSVRNDEGYLRLNYKNNIKFTQNQKLTNLIAVDSTNITNIDINTTESKVKMDLSATLNVTNPYRLNYSINTLYTNYTHQTEAQTSTNFAQGTSPDSEEISIVPAYIKGNWTHHNIDSILPRTTLIQHELHLEYDSNNLKDSGIAKIFEDLNIDPLTLNFSNPLWLMGPSGMGAKEYLDPLDVVEEMIRNRIDPLMLLKEVNVSRAYNYGDRAWRPLGESAYFGTNFENKDISMATPDFPIDEMNYIWDYCIPSKLIPGSSWLDSYNSIKAKHQFEIVKKEGSWEWPDDDNTEPLMGFISTDITESEITSRGLDYIPTEKLKWRIYSANTGHFWGYKYDKEYFQRNWFIISEGESNLVFRQNVTIPTELINSPEDVENAILSMSYRYPSGYGDSGRFGIGYWNESKGNSRYIYVGENSGSSYDISQGSTMSGYKCDLTDILRGEKSDWQHRSVNVTDVIKIAIQNYINNGSQDTRWLQIEVAFSALSEAVIYIDDVDLAVEYWSDQDTQFDIQDFFYRIEEISEVDRYTKDAINSNNLFKFFDDIDFDATNLISFFDSSNGVTPNGNNVGTGLNTYHSVSDSKTSRIISLFQDLDKIDKIDAGEELNFFDMLNSSKWIIDDNQFNNVLTGDLDSTKNWGYRSLIKDEGWVIEDPYVASREFIRALYENIFIDEKNDYRYAPEGQNVLGKELWFMLENLGVDFPWIVIYLLMHGWSNDDIFDMLEALGLMRETKHNFYNIADSYGNMTQHIELSNTVNFVIDYHPYTDYPVDLVVEFDEPISNAMKSVYSYLCADPNRNLITLKGDLSNPNVIELEPIDFGAMTSTLSYKIMQYSVNVGIRTLPGSLIAPDFLSPGFNKDTSMFLDSDDGLNDKGAAMLTRYLRQSIYLKNVPFIEYAGDPLSLFQFLDNYFFLLDANVAGSRNFDYSSYTLLNHFDVSAVDFVDLITGYNRFTGTHDPNGNGKADDWYAPENYGESGWTDRYAVPMDRGSTLYGWGNDVYNNRLFYTSTDEYYQYNGKVIWSDSPSFLEQDFDLSYNGIINNSLLETTHNFNGGAPPIVNLIDMFAWLTRITSLDSKKVFDWLEGRLNDEEYLIPNHILYGVFIDEQNGYSYEKGIGAEKVWNMLDKMTFNVTNLYSWMENVKGANAYGLLYELNNWNPNDESTMRAHGTSSPDPMALFYYAQNPNFYQYGDGSVSQIFHNGLGSTSIESTVNFWKLFNGTWWAQNEIVPDYFGSPSQPETSIQINAASNWLSGPITLLKDDILTFNIGLNEDENHNIIFAVIPYGEADKYILNPQSVEVLLQGSLISSNSFTISKTKQTATNYQILIRNTNPISNPEPVSLSYSYTISDIADRIITSTLPYIVLERLNINAVQQYNTGKSGSELTYNLFQFLLDLYILPEDWINALQNHGMYPFEILAVYDSLNIERLLRQAAENDKKTIIKVQGSFRFNYNGLDLFVQTDHENNFLQYSVDDSPYTASDNLEYLFETTRFSSTAGTYSIHG